MRIFYYVIASILLFLGILCIERLFEKADLPFQYEHSESLLICASDFSLIKKGDVIKNVNGRNATTPFELEFILDGNSIDEAVQLLLLDNSRNEKNVFVTLVPYYKGNQFIYISLLVGLAFWLSAVFVISKRPEEKSAKLLYWIFLIFSLAIMSPSPPYYSSEDIIGYILRISHVVTYLMGVILFIHFTYVFPHNKLETRNKLQILSLLYFPALILCTLLSISIINAMSNVNSWGLISYEFLWRIAVQIYLVLGILGGVYHLYRTYRKTNVKEEKSKIEWIFWGITAGVFPFIIFWVIPDILTLDEIISEEILLSFLIIAPASFIIAVIKYHILDIEILVKRSVLYSILSVLILIMYFALVAFLTNIFHIIEGVPIVISLLVTFLIAVLFNPMRLKLKEIIDKTFTGSDMI